jgi:DNA replication and repair protein RecF
VLLARGSSHRTGTDADMIRWAAPFARVDGRRGGDGGAAEVDVTLVREGPSGGRKRIRVNGVPRRSTALAGVLRTVVFAPEEMLLVVGAPSLRRAALDALATQRFPAYAADLSTYGRALTQRNHLLRAIREEQASREQLAFWDAKLVEAGAAVLEARARRLRETAEKELWNGTTLVGPHRDDLAFAIDGRDLSSFASRGQQRTAILALKLAELDLLAALDGRPPLLLLDDVFSELDPARRAHLVRRIAMLPQAFVTTTTLDDLDPALRAAGTAWRVVAGGPSGQATAGGGSFLVEAAT